MIKQATRKLRDASEDQLVEVVAPILSSLYGAPEVAEDTAKPAAPPLQSATVADTGPTVGWAPIALWSGAGVALGAGVFFGQRAKQHHNKARSLDIGSQIEAQATKDNTLRANLSFGAAALLAAVGFTVWLWPEEESQPVALMVGNSCLAATVRF